MATKKLPISLNDSDQKNISELEILFFGQAGAYGSNAKVIKLSINFTKNYLESIANSIPDLKEPELDLLLSSVKKLILSRIAKKNVEIAKKEAKKYNP